MNIIIPSVTQEEEDPTMDSSPDTKRVTFSDNVTVHNFDNGEPKKSCRPKKAQGRQRKLLKKAVVPTRYKLIQVRSFHKRSGQVIAHF